MNSVSILVAMHIDTIVCSGMGMQRCGAHIARKHPMFRHIYGPSKQMSKEPKMELEHVDADHRSSDFEMFGSVALSMIYRMKDDAKPYLAKSERFSWKGNGLKLRMLPMPAPCISF